MSMTYTDVRDGIDYIFRANPEQAIMLWGKPGVGKSSIVKDLGQIYEVPVIEWRTSQMQPPDVRGIPRVTDEGRTEFCPPAELPDGGEGIFFLDEVNAGSRAVQAAIMEFVLDRRLGTYHLPPDWRILAAGNYTTDRAVANAMPTSLANRFAHFELEPDVNSLVQYGLSQGWPVELLQFLRLRPELVHNMDTSRDTKAFPSPRSWEFVAKLDFMNLADKPILQKFLIKSCIGQGAMAEFTAFLELFGSLPSIDDILHNPETAPIPDEMTAKYAIAAALIKAAADGTIEAIATYMGRFEEKEFSVMAMKDIVSTKPQLNQQLGMVQWMVDNQHFLMN